MSQRTTLAKQLPRSPWRDYAVPPRSRTGSRSIREVRRCLPERRRGPLWRRRHDGAGRACSHCRGWQGRRWPRSRPCSSAQPGKARMRSVSREPTCGMRRRGQPDPARKRSRRPSSDTGIETPLFMRGRASTGRRPPLPELGSRRSWLRAGQRIERMTDGHSSESAECQHSGTGAEMPGGYPRARPDFVRNRGRPRCHRGSAPRTGAPGTGRFRACCS